MASARRVTDTAPAPRKRSEVKLERELVASFLNGGYVRCQNPERRVNEGHRRYKKGAEVRFVAGDDEHLARIEELLLLLGFRPGKVWWHRHRARVPIYGREEVARLLAMVERHSK